MSQIVLRGLDAANPLGFLAALGTLRLLSSAQPDCCLHWIPEAKWHPVLSGLTEVDESSLAVLLATLPSAPTDTFSRLGKNITVSPDTFVAFAKDAEATAIPGDRRAADFAAAFGSEACKHEKLERIQYTDLCFITGSGHQDFLETMKALKLSIQPEQLHQTLFHPWRYNDKGLSFRWDPADAREYALRWNDPGPEGAWTDWGANFLAVEALPFFPAQPTSKGLQTTGFSKHDRDQYLTWPVWTTPIGCDAVSSVLAIPELQQEEKRLERQSLSSRGIAAAYRSQRVRIGEGANFKVSFRPSRAI
jgi:hypothetical protein